MAGNSCRNCLTRMPYGTIIGTIMCLAGAGVFCASFFRGVGLTRLMFEQVFHFRAEWLYSVQLGFVIFGGVMGAVDLMILFVGCLTTGETRAAIYMAWQTRVGGRISCAVFIVLAYLFQLVWLGLFGLLFVATAMFYIFSSLCAHKRQPYDEFNCIDFTQFHFLFPNNTRQEDMKVCEANEMKLFCKDYSERAEILFFVATIASGVVILSLAHFLTCLSANYAHIKDYKKLKDYQDLYYHSIEPELTASGGKDRYEDEGRIY